MEVPMLRTIMVLLHLLHTPTVFYQDQWADVVPSTAPLAILVGCCSMLMGPQGFFQRKARTTREVNLTLSRINRGEYFSSSSSSPSCCVSSLGTGGSTTVGSRLHHHNLAKQGYHSNHGNHHHQSPSTQHTHPSSHVSSSVCHSLGTQEGRKRGRRKRTSAAAVSACSSPKRRSFPGLGSNGPSSGSPLNINSMVSTSV